jgi:hypothetical protein
MSIEDLIFTYDISYGPSHVCFLQALYFSIFNLFYIRIYCIRVTDTYLRIYTVGVYVYVAALGKIRKYIIDIQTYGHRWFNRLYVHILCTVCTVYNESKQTL